MRRRNIIAAVVLIVSALFYGGLTAQLPTRTLPNTPDPSFFPWINTAIILALSVLLLARTLWWPAPERAKTHAWDSCRSNLTSKAARQEHWRAMLAKINSTYRAPRF